MNIFTKEFSPPQTLTTKTFCLFPTHQDFYESDYTAVMNTRALLRIWSQSPWPEDDFTPQMNKDDLLHHIEDNKTHAAYGYMIYSLDKKTCYGSLYVNPLAAVPDNYHTTKEEADLVRSHQGRLDCWIVDENSDLEKTIISEIKNWFESTWKIKFLFSARVGMNKRISIYEDLGLECQADLKSKTSEMTLLLF